MSALHIAAAVFGVLAIGGFVFQILSIYSAVRFLHRPSSPKSSAPPVSILKPLKGFDPGMYECFRSHCLQDYPAEYEIIFGVNDASDPAVVAVERLRRECPERQISLLVCSEILGTNRKVSNLVQMAAHAKYDILIVNDSDIQVPPDYLRRVTSPFADPQVGMVTALYRGVPERTFASNLEGLAIATDFAGGVLSALVVDGGLHFALGSTLAISRKALDKIGGFQPLADYLADDYELGVRTAAAGLRVELADVVVETHLHSYSFREMLQHQLRWARTIRDKRKAGYLGMVFTFGLVWAVVTAILSGGAWWGLITIVAVALARFVNAYVLAGPVLHDRHSLRNLWLVPVRDAIGVVVWLASFFGNTVVWRGERFRLSDGKLLKID